MEEKSPEEEQNPDLIEQYHPSAEETEQMIKDHPPSYIRAYAANMSHYHPDKLYAKLSHEDDILKSMKAKLNLTNGTCFDNCG